MKLDWRNTLNQIEKIEGYLVPGQETTLFKLARSMKPGSTIVEIGSYMGRSTACLAAGSGKGVKIYAIDTFEGNKNDFVEEVQFKGGAFYNKFERNLKRLGLFSKVHPLHGYSSDIGQKWRKKIDLIFVDGSHVYEDVRKDFELFFPWVKPGGIIAFHDVSQGHPGVYRLWNETVKKKVSAYMHETSLYFGVKPSKKSSPRKDKEKLREIFDFEKEKVTVILPIYNRLTFTKQCLASLQRQTYKNLQVIIVDAGSTDGTQKFIKSEYSDYKIIFGSNSWWWTRSMFEGVKKAIKTSRKGDFILTMNNDCYFKEDYVSNIVEASKANKRDIVGSLILDAGKTDKVIDAGVKIVWSECLLYGVAPHYSEDINFFTERELIDDIDTLPGKGTLIPIEVFRRVGNFNYRLLPHYIGDYEFFCRAKRAGFSLVVSADAKLFNFVGETGTVHILEDRASFSKVYSSLFSHKSKLNIFDHLIFILLCCPRKYLFINLKSELFEFIHQILKMFPFYYIPPTVYKLSLFVHNTPIFIRQNRTGRKFRSQLIKKIQHFKLFKASR